jgi:hypothetical protein
MIEAISVAAPKAARHARRDAAPGFAVVTQSHPVWPNMTPLRDAIEQANDGDCVAFAVPLDAPLVARLMTLATFRWQRRRAERAIRGSGGKVVAHFGVDPSLARPSWWYELDTPASEYADRFMRPRGTHLTLRRIAQRCFGCDPALGGVMVVGKKSC